MSLQQLVFTFCFWIFVLFFFLFWFLLCSFLGWPNNRKATTLRDIVKRVGFLLLFCGWCRRLQCNFCKAQQKCSTTSDNRKLDEHYGCWDKPQLPLTESKSERERWSGWRLGEAQGTCHIAQWCPGNWQLAVLPDRPSIQNNRKPKLHIIYECGFCCVCVGECVWVCVWA